MVGGDEEGGLIRVVIVDDHALMRAGIRQLRAETDDIVVVGEAADGEEAQEVVRELQPDLVLMDLSMPRVNGTTATRRLRESHPHLCIVVLSSYVDSSDVLEALDAGAAGYLVKDAGPDELLVGIRAAASEGSPMAPQAARELLLAWRRSRVPGDLTSRELDVLALLGQGLPNKVIARRLGIAEKTVKAHVTHIFQALQVTDRTQAALWVGRNTLPPRRQERSDGVARTDGH